MFVPGPERVVDGSPGCVGCLSSSPMPARLIGPGIYNAADAENLVVVTSLANLVRQAEDTNRAAFYYCFGSRDGWSATSRRDHPHLPGARPPRQILAASYAGRRS